MERGKGKEGVDADQLARQWPNPLPGTGWGLAPGAPARWDGSREPEAPTADEPWPRLAGVRCSPVTASKRASEGTDFQNENLRLEWRTDGLFALPGPGITKNAKKYFRSTA